MVVNEKGGRDDMDKPRVSRDLALLSQAGRGSLRALVILNAARERTAWQA